MAKVQIKALDAFSHGRINATRGGKYTIGASEAESLKAAGLVEIVGDAAEDDIDDLVGAKTAPLTSNKMAAKPDNKGAKK